MSEDQLIQMTLRGSNALPFLQGYITCDLEHMMAQSAIPMALTQLNGRVIANGWVFGSPHNIALVVHESLKTSVQTHLEPYMRFDTSEWEDQVKAIYIIDLKSANPDVIKLHQLDWALSERNANSVELSEFQLKSGYPLTTSETSGRFLPQMLNLTSFDAVSFSKGCYLGQEIVARAEHRGRVKRNLGTFNLDRESIQIGSEVSTEDGIRGVVIARNDQRVLMVSNGQSQE